MNNRLLPTVVLLCLPCLSVLSAQDVAPASLFEYLYHQQGPLPVLRLETDWKLLIRNKLEEEYQPGVLSFQGPGGVPVDLEVSIRARGNTRKEVCLLPPVKIKAARRQLGELGFHPGRKLKLVLPCENGKANAECLLKEALAYRLFEEIYPIHHRTKIVELQGWHKGREKYSLYAFLVEEEKEFAARVNGKRVNQGRINTIDLDRDAYVKMCFFQYMIGNTDWSAPNGHNLEVLELPGYEKLVAIPYDFDYAGFVETDYAIPRSSVPIEDVTQRFFLGKYVTEEEALECAAYYRSRKEQILQACREFNLLDEKTSEHIQEYLGVFFARLEDEEEVRQSFVTWRKRPEKN